jgi:hypothetical protein
LAGHCASDAAIPTQHDRVEIILLNKGQNHTHLVKVERDALAFDPRRPHDGWGYATELFRDLELKQGVIGAGFADVGNVELKNLNDAV